MKPPAEPGNERRAALTALPGSPLNSVRRRPGGAIVCGLSYKALPSCCTLLLPPGNIHLLLRIDLSFPSPVADRRGAAAEAVPVGEHSYLLVSTAT